MLIRLQNEPPSNVGRTSMAVGEFRMKKKRVFLFDFPKCCTGNVSAGTWKRPTYRPATIRVKYIYQKSELSSWT